MGSVENPDIDYNEYWRVRWDTQLVTAFSIVLVAYSCQQNLFPMYSSLKERTSETASKAMALSLCMTFAVYVTVGIISVYMFGSTLDESVLDDVDAETNVDSYIIRISFLIVLACHIPYIFFSGKESLLIMIDECRTQSMTKALESTI